jgi:hypothetical protein
VEPQQRQIQAAEAELSQPTLADTVRESKQATLAILRKRLENMAPKAATPSAPPVWRTMMPAAVAVPIVCRGTAFCTAVVTTGKMQPMPRPTQVSEAPKTNMLVSTCNWASSTMPSVSITAMGSLSPDSICNRSRTRAGIGWPQCTEDCRSVSRGNHRTDQKRRARRYIEHERRAAGSDGGCQHGRRGSPTPRPARRPDGLPRALSQALLRRGSRPGQRSRRSVPTSASEVDQLQAVVGDHHSEQ